MYFIAFTDTSTKTKGVFPRQQIQLNTISTPHPLPLKKFTGGEDDGCFLDGDHRVGFTLLKHVEAVVVNGAGDFFGCLQYEWECVDGVMEATRVGEIEIGDDAALDIL